MQELTDVLFWFRHFRETSSPKHAASDVGRASLANGTSSRYRSWLPNHQAEVRCLVTKRQLNQIEQGGAG